MQSETTNKKSFREKFTLTDTTRAVEWWEFKIAPMFATVYATAVLSQSSLLSLRFFPLFLLVSLAVGGAYVSLINDLTDVEDDAASGKRNRLANKSVLFKTTLLLFCLLPGLAINIFWARVDSLTFYLYLSAWIAYTLYSLSPFRFKKRGFLGVLADASGAHLFPQLYIVSATSFWLGQPVNFKWFAAVGVWSLACGVRGILWHQVLDASNDIKANVNTFVRKHSRATACWLGERIIFRIELLAFVAMIIIARNYIAAIFLVIYFLLVWARSVVWEIDVVIVAPQKKYQILMHEYYEVFYPLAFLLTAVFRSPLDIFFLVAHFILFPRRAVVCIKEIFQVILDGKAQNKSNQANPFEIN